MLLIVSLSVRVFSVIHLNKWILNFLRILIYFIYLSNQKQAGWYFSAISAVCFQIKIHFVRQKNIISTKFPTLYVLVLTWIRYVGIWLHQNIELCQINVPGSRRVQDQDVHFFYVRFHFSEPKSCKSIFSIIFQSNHIK